MHSTNQRNSYVILWVSLVSVFFIGFILDRHLESKTSAKVVVKHPLEASNQEKHLLARKRVVFFGDSITEGYPFDRNISSWTSVLINWWTRRADTFNRGFSGYNSDLALMILQDTVLSVKPDLVLIFFGANDAAVPSDLYDKHCPHVPVSRYRENLIKMITRINQDCTTTNIILISPPPVCESTLKIWLHQSFGAALDRFNDKTAEYARVCVEIGQELKSPVVDVWTYLGGLEKEEVRCPYFCDGLHLSASGNNRLAEAIQLAVTQALPSFDPSNMLSQLPSLSEIDFEHPDESLRSYGIATALPHIAEVK